MVPGYLLGPVCCPVPSALVKPLGWSPLPLLLPQATCRHWPSLASCGASIFRALAVSSLWKGKDQRKPRNSPRAVPRATGHGNQWDTGHRETQLLSG